MNGKTIRVPIAGYGIGTENDTLYTVLGSCVAVMFYDKIQKIGGMIHIMLGHAKRDIYNPTKYADTGIPFIISQMINKGANPYSLAGVKVVGGSMMFPVHPAGNSVSTENVRIVREELHKRGIKIIKSDFGGTCGRSVIFDIKTGRVTVIAQGEKERKLQL